MKIPRWIVPVVLQLLSLTAGQSVRFGVALSAPAIPTESLSQPRPQNLSLDLDFFVQVADHEFKMPL
jgi:hypothetical protein